LRVSNGETKLKTIEQVREFLAGTADVSFSIPADESTLRAFVSTVIRRFDYFRLTKGQRYNGVRHHYQPFRGRPTPFDTVRLWVSASIFSEKRVLPNAHPLCVQSRIARRSSFPTAARNSCR